MVSHARIVGVSRSRSRQIQLFETRPQAFTVSFKPIYLYGTPGPMVWGGNVRRASASLPLLILPVAAQRATEHTLETHVRLPFFFYPTDSTSFSTVPPTRSLSFPPSLSLSFFPTRFENHAVIRYHRPGATWMTKALLLFPRRKLTSIFSGKKTNGVNLFVICGFQCC